MIQQIIVGLIVAVAAIAVAKRYAPRPLKQAARMSAVRMAKSMKWTALAARLAQPAQAGASCGDGCGSCGNCGTAPAAGPSQSTVSTISVEKLKETLRR